MATPGPEPTGATPVVPASPFRRPGAGAGADATLAQVPVVTTPATGGSTVGGKTDRKADRKAGRTAVRQAAYVPPELSKAGRRRRRRWPFVLLALILLGAGVGAGSYFLVSQRAPSHPLPNVIDQTELEAATALRNLNFDVEISQEFFDGSVPGLVRLQDPPGGGSATLKEGKRVTLIVSKGPPPTLVPDLATLDEAGARRVIEGAGHVVGTVTPTFSETVAEGLVVDWTRKGESPPKGATVDLVVSAGPEPRELPNLVGATFDEAVAALAALDLEPARVDAFNDDDGTAGRVVGTSPGSGEQVTRGATVTVTVSKGRPTVPKLGGLSAGEAAAALGAVGLEVGSTFGPSGGDVFLSLPGEGTKVKPGSSVTIYLL